MKQILLILFLFAYKSMYSQKDNKIYTIVEQQPEYPEGQAALFRYLNKNIKYPKEAREKPCGAMMLKFIIEINGKPTFVSCEFPNCKLNCPEVRKAINKMPKWKAGRQNGKPVRVAYTLPIRIKWE